MSRAKQDNIGLFLPPSISLCWSQSETLHAWDSWCNVGQLGHPPQVPVSVKGSYYGQLRLKYLPSLCLILGQVSCRV